MSWSKVVNRTLSEKNVDPWLEKSLGLFENPETKFCLSRMPIACFVKCSPQRFINNWHRTASDYHIQPWFSVICTMTIFFALYRRLVSFAVPVQLQMFSTFGSSCSFGRSLNRRMSRLLLILGEVCWEPGKTNTIIKPSPSFFSVRHRPPKIWFQEPLQKWDESRLCRKTAKQKVALRQRDLKKLDSDEGHVWFLRRLWKPRTKT